MEEQADELYWSKMLYAIAFLKIILKKKKKSSTSSISWPGFGRAPLLKSGMILAKLMISYSETHIYPLYTYTKHLEMELDNVISFFLCRKIAGKGGSGQRD